MPRKPMETLSEGMFYSLMALKTGPMCGIEITDFIDKRTDGRLLIGPGTLYVVLANFEKEGLIREILVQGRKRTYEITEKGLSAYHRELDRLRACVADAERD